MKYQNKINKNFVKIINNNANNVKKNFKIPLILKILVHINSFNCNIFYIGKTNKNFKIR
jgi:hypothetical protein